MRTTSKIVLVIIIITLVYSVVKLINASAPQEQTIATITWPVNQPTNNTQNNLANMPQNTTQNATPNTQSQSSATVYQADEILIAEASVSINNNQAQNYAPGMPAFEVLNGN